MRITWLHCVKCTVKFVGRDFGMIMIVLCSWVTGNSLELQHDCVHHIIDKRDWREHNHIKDEVMKSYRSLGLTLKCVSCVCVCVLPTWVLSEAEAGVSCAASLGQQVSSSGQHCSQVRGHTQVWINNKHIHKTHTHKEIICSHISQVLIDSL